MKSRFRSSRTKRPPVSRATHPLEQREVLGIGEVPEAVPHHNRRVEPRSELGAPDVGNAEPRRDSGVPGTGTGQAHVLRVQLEAGSPNAPTFQLDRMASRAGAQVQDPIAGGQATLGDDEVHVTARTLRRQTAEARPLAEVVVELLEPFHGGLGG